MSGRGKSKLGWLAAVALLVGAAAGNADAAAPDAKYLFPAGAARGTTVEITAGGNVGDGPTQVWVNRLGVQIVAVAEKAKFAVTVAADAVPGIYWVRLYNGEGASVPLPFVVGTLPEVNEQEPNDSLTMALALPGTAYTVNGRLEKRGDVDMFAVSLKQGQTLAAGLTANETLRSPMDAVLQIVSSRGSVLAQNDDERGLDPLLPYTAPADGVYLVRVFAFPATGDASISFAGGDNFIYRLTLTTGGYVDATLPLAITRGGPTEVEAFGWNLADPEKKRTLEAVADASEFDFYLPSWADSVTLLVVPHRSLVEVEPNDAAKPQLMEAPATISGRLGEPRDRDAFRIHLAKGQAWQFKLESRSLGYPLDAVLELFDAAGKSLARADDTGNNPDAELKYTAPADGDFTLVVSDLYEHGGPRFFYRFTLALLEPDFSLSVAQHAYLLNAGKPLEIPITIERRQNFTGDIEFKVLGLPEGITASPVKSITKDDTVKTVKLLLTATIASFSGPIRVLGASTEPASRSHFAESEVPAYARLSDVWLTVAP